MIPSFGHPPSRLLAGPEGIWRSDECGLVASEGVTGSRAILPRPIVDGPPADRLVGFAAVTSLVTSEPLEQGEPHACSQPPHRRNPPHCRRHPRHHRRGQGQLGPPRHRRTRRRHRAPRGTSPDRPEAVGFLTRAPRAGSLPDPARVARSEPGHRSLASEPRVETECKNSRSGSSHCLR